jgi:hypothetical protein
LIAVSEERWMENIGNRVNMTAREPILATSYYALSNYFEVEVR